MPTTETQHVRTEIRLEGVFDIAAAKRVAAELEDARYADVRIDLTGVREFNDFGVALLGEIIGGRRSPTEVVGLNARHLRLLHLLGVDVGAARIEAGAEPG